ncbi:MAG TPA: ABC transporter ATP-binding protein [Pyrinomonadaceae bacterium]|jgi:ABC-2 type transport system ATP-binding protein
MPAPAAIEAAPARAHAAAAAAARAAVSDDSARAAPAISIKGLAKVYPIPLARVRQFVRRKGAQGPTEALRDVTFDVRAGEVFGLIGRNGAGKTTLTKIIATLVQPTAGTVTVNGLDSVRAAERVRAQVGLASAEERTFYWRLTVEQNLLFFARLHGLTDAAARRRIGALLERFELTELARKRFGELSTGNKQRTTVARALLNRPPVLLLDEPTRSLDPLAAASMRALISRLAADERVTVLLTSHNLPEIEELCARIAVISRGRIRAVGAPADLRATHKQTERVTLTVKGLAAAEVERLLAAAVNDLTATPHDDAAVAVTFTREADDDRLDFALRALTGAGARVLACDAERATLLDVLERIEREHEADAARAATDGGRNA